PVDRRGIEDLLALVDPAGAVPAAVEAAPLAGVAGRAAHLLDVEQDRVAVAVDAQRLQHLDVPALLALVPEPAAAAPVDDLAAREGLPQRLLVQVRDHQDLARLGVA